MALYSPPVSARNVTEYQTIMSNTAHQREVMDLKAAGLNPILSAHGSGASTPQGDASDFTGAVQSLASSAVSSAHAASKAVKTVETLGDTLKDLIKPPVAVTDSGTGNVYAAADAAQSSARAAWDQFYNNFYVERPGNNVVSRVTNGLLNLGNALLNNVSSLPGYRSVPSGGSAYNAYRRVSGNAGSGRTYSNARTEARDAYIANAMARSFR